MVSIKQWVLTALASVALVSFVTHECLRVDLPRDASHAAWKEFVETHLAFYSAADQRRAWLVLMGVQGLQLALGIPFLHVTQVCMGFVLPVAVGIASCTCLEMLAFAGYVWLGDRAIATPDLHTLSYIMTIARTHRQRLAYTFALLMSSMPIYISVLSVHVKLVSRREFWYLSGAVSLFSVSKNIVLGALLFADTHRTLTVALALVVFFSPLVCTVLVIGAGACRDAPAGKGEDEVMLTATEELACSPYEDVELADITPGALNTTDETTERIVQILDAGGLDAQGLDTGGLDAEGLDAGPDAADKAADITADNAGDEAAGNAASVAEQNTSQARGDAHVFEAVVLKTHDKTDAAKHAAKSARKYSARRLR